MADLQSKENLSLSHNEEIIFKVYKALNQGDRKAYLSLIDRDVVWQTMEGFPHGGTYVGLEKVLDEFFPALMRDFDDWIIAPDEILDAGDSLVGLGHYRGRAKASNLRVDAAFAHVFRVKGDKVVRVQQYTDTVKFMRALTANP